MLLILHSVIVEFLVYSRLSSYLLILYFSFSLTCFKESLGLKTDLGFNWSFFDTHFTATSFTQSCRYSGQRTLSARNPAFTVLYNFTPSLRPFKPVMFIFQLLILYVVSEDAISNSYIYIPDAQNSLLEVQL